MGSVRTARPAALLACAAVALGCAGATSDAPTAAAAFRGVRSVALVRRVDRGEKRPKDPLDAVSESLAAKGIAVRVIELGGRDDPKDVARLFDSAESRASSVGPDSAVGALGGDAARTVRGLGVDAVVSYHRLDSRASRALGNYPATPGGGIAGAYSRPTERYRPLGALAVVGTDGQAAVFEWGARDAQLGQGVETPAEAVDAVVRALLGEQGDPDA
jgi:hypothetical protein